jgi:hypothetical protein
MQCQNIVLLNLSTNDSVKELDENRKSLKSKYDGRGQKCIEVNYWSGKIEKLDKTSGTVGVYVLSHSKDVNPPTLAKRLFDELFAVGVDVRKINIACCRASEGQGPMQKFCEELQKCQTADTKLPQGLMVCGFNVNVTTFDCNSTFTEEEGKKFENYARIKESAKQQGRSVATVKQGWAHSEGEPNFLSFVHEKVGPDRTPAFISEAERLFQQKLDEQWNLERGDFILKYNNGLKPRLRIEDPQSWSWAAFVAQHNAGAKRYVREFWPKFMTLLKGLTPESASMWASLDSYMKMKIAMKFDREKGFQRTTLSEYTENKDLKQALEWVRAGNDNKGVNLRFLPDV